MKTTMQKTLMFFGVSIALVISAGCDILHFKPRNTVKMVAEAPDIGYATNCGSVPFNFSWTPKDLDPSGKVTLTADYLIPHDFDGGFLNASVYFHDDPEPFLGYADKVTCDDVKHYFPMCPIRKGLHIKKSKTIYDLHKLAVFPGKYDFRAEVLNKKHQQMICIMITVEIKPNN